MLAMSNSTHIINEKTPSCSILQETYHVGYVRNEETLEATEYLNKLPKTLSKDDLVLVSDPMLATGGTIVKVL